MWLYKKIYQPICHMRNKARKQSLHMLAWMNLNFKKKEGHCSSHFFYKPCHTYIGIFLPNGEDRRGLHLYHWHLRKCNTNGHGDPVACYCFAQNFSLVVDQDVYNKTKGQVVLLGTNQSQRSNSFVTSGIPGAHNYIGQMMTNWRTESKFLAHAVYYQGCTFHSVRRIGL